MTANVLQIGGNILVAVTQSHVLVCIQETNPSVVVAVLLVAVVIRRILSRLAVAPVDDLHLCPRYLWHGFVAASVIINENLFYTQPDVVLHELKEIVVFHPRNHADGHIIDVTLAWCQVPQACMFIEPPLPLLFLVLVPRTTPQMFEAFRRIRERPQRRLLVCPDVFKECRASVIPCAVRVVAVDAPASRAVIVVNAQPTALRRIDVTEHRPQPLDTVRIVPPLVDETDGRYALVE